MAEQLEKKRKPCILVLILLCFRGMEILKSQMEGWSFLPECLRHSYDDGKGQDLHQRRLY